MKTETQNDWQGTSSTAAASAIKEGVSGRKGKKQSRIFQITSERDHPGSGASPGTLIQALDRLWIFYRVTGIMGGCGRKRSKWYFRAGEWNEKELQLEQASRTYTHRGFLSGKAA